MPMDPLPTLPAELSLTIISHLRIPEFHILQILSKSYNIFFQKNESYIYRNAAIRHNFVSFSSSCSSLKISDIQGNSTNVGATGSTSKSVSLKDAMDEWEIERRGSMNGVDSWKGFCHCIYLLERNFEGQGPNPPILRKSAVTGTNVHHFKVDEENRFIICTHATGGLTVSSFEGDKVFSLDESYTPNFAHVEYSNGFVIFNRNLPRALEVWKLETPCLDVQLDSNAKSTLDVTNFATQDRDDILHSRNKQLQEENFYPPHPSQFYAASPHSGQSYRNPALESKQPPQLGCFSPFSLITLPSPPLAWRLSFPALLIATSDCKQLYIFDILRRRLIEKVVISGHPWFRHPRRTHQHVNDVANWDFAQPETDADSVGSEVEDEEDGLGIAEFDPSESCIKYVELSRTHIFVCTTYGLLIISRLSRDSDPPDRIFESTLSLDIEPFENKSVLHVPSPSLPRSLRIPSLSRNTAVKAVSVSPKSYLILSSDKEFDIDFKCRAESMLRTLPMYSKGVEKVMKHTLLVPFSAQERPSQMSSEGSNNETVVGPPGYRSLQMFSAVHVSPDGKHFAAITRRGLLYLVKDFERLYQQPMAGSDNKDPSENDIRHQKESDIFENTVLRIDLASPATSMAYEFGRLLVQTRKAIYIINWDTSHHDVLPPPTLESTGCISPSSSSQTLKYIMVHALRPFSHLHILPLVKCVQLTRTRAWVTWAPSALKKYQYDICGRKSSRMIVRPWTSGMVQANEYGLNEEDNDSLSDSESDYDDDNEEETRRNLYLPPPFGLSLDTHRTVCCMDFYPKL